MAESNELLNFELAGQEATINNLRTTFTLNDFHGNQMRAPPLVFSHLEHTTSAATCGAVDNSSGATAVDSIPFHHGMEQNRHQRNYLIPGSGLEESHGGGEEEEEERERVEGEGKDGHSGLLTQLQSLTMSSSQTDFSNSETTTTVPHEHQSIEESHTQWAWSRGGSHGNCREEALGMMGYVDDVTVDDLAGYFDQMLHLPRPMSDMAQLMYT